MELTQRKGIVSDHDNSVSRILGRKKVKSMYQYRTLENTSYEQLAECFCLAFSDYYFPMKLSPQQLQGHLEQSGVDLRLSYGAFAEDRLIGFIFNSSSLYNGQRAVFDVGTAVVPEHRGNQVFSQMFQVMEQQLAQQNIEAYYLEVLQQNERAVRLYQKHGFSIAREYIVLRAGDTPVEKVSFSGEEMEYSQVELSAVSHCTMVKPCFEHSTGVLQRNPHLYGVRTIRRQGKISAFCVYAKENGAILQLGYEELLDLKIILQSLVSTFSGISVKNIDAAYPQVLELFEELHFKEMTKQFEMSKKIGLAVETQRSEGR